MIISIYGYYFENYDYFYTLTLYLELILKYLLILNQN